MRAVGTSGSKRGEAVTLRAIDSTDAEESGQVSNHCDLTTAGLQIPREGK